MTTFTFTTPETYFKYVADWKQRYADRCKEQRRLKLEIRNLMREGKPAYASQWDLVRGVKDAKELIAERALSKVEAANQWFAAHKTPA